MNTEIRFDVFGRHMAVVRSARGWQVFALGNEGKRRLTQITIPDGVTESELAEYLADLFHEAATPQRGEVKRLQR